MCTQLQVVLHHLGVTSTLFWCKLTRIPRLHNTVLVFFYPIQIRIVSGSHYCGVNVHHVGVTFTLNWCSHSCKNLHFFGVTITLSLFLCLYHYFLYYFNVILILSRFCNRTTAYCLVSPKKSRKSLLYISAFTYK